MTKRDTDLYEVFLAMPEQARFELLRFLEGADATRPERDTRLDRLMTSINIRYQMSEKKPH